MVMAKTRTASVDGHSDTELLKALAVMALFPHTSLWDTKRLVSKLKQLLNLLAFLFHFFLFSLKKKKYKVHMFFECR